VRTFVIAHPKPFIFRQDRNPVKLTPDEQVSLSENKFDFRHSSARERRRGRNKIGNSYLALCCRATVCGKVGELTLKIKWIPKETN